MPSIFNVCTQPLDEQGQAKPCPCRYTRKCPDSTVMWDKTINGINRYGLFFADSLGEVLWHDPVFLFYLTITIVGLVALGVIRALTS